MDEVTILKNKVKEYLENADEKTIKMIYAMLEVDAQNDWWDDLPGSARNSINQALMDIENGKVTTHKEVIKKYEKSNPKLYRRSKRSNSFKFLE